MYPPQGFQATSELILPAVLPNVGQITGTAWSGSAAAVLSFNTYDTTGTLQTALSLNGTKAVVSAFQLTTGGALNSILMSDASGNASWNIVHRRPYDPPGRIVLRRFRRRQGRPSRQPPHARPRIGKRQ